MRYKYEFEADDFTRGNCLYCPLSHWGYDDKKHFGEMCVLSSSKEDCPLEEVEMSKSQIFALGAFFGYCFACVWVYVTIF